MKTAAVSYNEIHFEVQMEYVDNSFSHDFGMKIQGQYEARSITLAGSKVDLLSVLDEAIIQKITERAERYINE